MFNQLQNDFYSYYIYNMRYIYIRKKYSSNDGLEANIDFINVT